MAHGKSSMFHVWLKSISGNLSVTVLRDFESVVTRRYDLREMAAAIAAYQIHDVSRHADKQAVKIAFQHTLPCTTACSPNTITLPGADTMKAGIIGLDFLRSILRLWVLGPGSATPLASLEEAPLV